MVGLVIWFVVGWATVLIQNRWGYQFMLPLVPLGLLACYGIDRLHAGARRDRDKQRHQRLPAFTVVLVVVASAFALYPIKQVAHKVKVLASDDFALSSGGRQKFDDTFAPYYSQSRAAAAFVRQPGALPGRSTSRATR